MRTFAFLLSMVCILSATPPATAAAGDPALLVPVLPTNVEFNRDIRPILSDNCFYCHGPDPKHREAELRLDIRDEALAHKAFIPGKATESALFARIRSTDPDEQMPPPDSNKKLSARQQAILKRWIDQGAAYQQHWAYEPPVKAKTPVGEHPIDSLVRKRLSEAGLQPSVEADRRMLARRLYFDLLGLPPTPAEVVAFENDLAPDAYERLVDRLLADPHYGERMAIGWLDVVRFADTIGYHSDSPRNVWPYRDWVIKSFNDNKRFDRFTLEQIAGDLLSDASQETRVGSAFNRLLLSTEEGGAQHKDYMARMLTDRVRAIGTVWLGQTTGCCQCHDHKFDPFTTRDFYSLGAFFADIQEPILGPREDGMVVPSEKEQAQLEQLEAARKKLEPLLLRLEAAQQQWEADIVAYGVTLPELAKDSKASPADRNSAALVAASLEKDRKARPANELKAIEDYFRGKVNKLYKDEIDALAEATQARTAFYGTLPKCLVSLSTAKKRTVRILPRGNWMDESGEIVRPALPAFLPHPDAGERELTRLDLARWLVAPENPLPARTVMNRLWKQFFGTGLSKVVDDLGAQGEPPVHPELLDWLACEFIDSGWDTKHMIRSIVTSQTYRQTSIATPEQIAADPAARMLARQVPFRLDAELVRDNALSVSGLLVRSIGGPSVKPYQPDGYWDNLNFPVRKYDNSTGEAQHRRGLYTWWQRSFLHPSLLAFDAPSREECAAERNRSCLPQQALVLMNDPTYVEAARGLAARIVRECHGTIRQRIDWAIGQVLQRSARPSELDTLEPLFTAQLAGYRSDPSAAQALLKTGEAPAPSEIDAGELAAWTHVARVLLNLHETITRS